MNKETKFKIEYTMSYTFFKEFYFIPENVIIHMYSFIPEMIYNNKNNNTNNNMNNKIIITSSIKHSH